MSIVSNNIKYLRKLNGYTQEQLAQRIGIKRSLLGAYEEARANPNSLSLDNMSKEFGVPVELILNDDLRERQRKTGTLFRHNLPQKAAESREEPPPPKTFVPKEKAAPEVLPAGNSNQMGLFSHAPEAPPAVTHPAPAPATPPALPAAALGNLAMEALQYREGGRYRTFEPGKDFFPPGNPTPSVPTPGGILLITSRSENFYTLKNAVPYVVVTRALGTLYRRVFNQMKAKGTLILSSDFAEFPVLELRSDEILETWEVIACISTTLPTPGHRIRELVRELGHLVGE